MNSEDTVLDNQSNKDEETVVSNAQNNEETIVNNAESTEVKSNESVHPFSENGNKRKRAAAVSAGVGVAASAAAGAYFMNNEENEDMVAEPASEQMEPEEHTANVQSQPHHTAASVSTPESEPIVESTSTSEQNVASGAEQTSEAEPIIEQTPASEPSPDALVVEPDVEILGVEVVNTENGDITLGGVTVNGENYVLVDVDGGDFDVAWHDDNQDNQIQENELIDISDSHISVNDFAQAANNGNDDNISNNDNLIAENNMDPMDTGEIDYMDTSDTSGLV